MNIHDQIEEWIAASVTDGLSAEERKNLEQHLSACERCRTLHEEEKNMSQAITGAFAAIKPDPNFEQRVLQKFRRRSAGKSRFHLVSWLLSFGQMRGVQWAAALLLFAAMIKGGTMITGESRPMSGVGSSGIADPGDPQRFLGDIPVMGHLFRRAGEDSVESAENGASANAPALPLQDASKKIAAEKSESQFESRFGFKDTGSVTLGSGNFYSGGTSISGGNVRSDGRRGAASADFKERTLGFNTNSGVEKGGALAFNKSETDSLAASPTSNVPANGKQNRAEPESESAALQTQPPVPAQPQADRKLIRNATLAFEVKSFEAALETVHAVSGEEQGYVATADSARGANGKLSGTIIVKILPANLDRFLLKLRALGELKNQKLGSEDVTKAYFDTDARLRNSKRMEERLLDMLQKNTGKVSDLLQVEKELARVREQIEQMQGELKFWDTQVAYATVTISLFEKDLNQPAAFLLKERANLSLFSPDVEKTYASAKREAETAKAQVVQSKLERDSDGRISATLSLLLAPESADQTIARMKTLGRVQTFTTQDERVAQGGSGASDTARVERDKVQFNLVISHDDESRRQTNLAVVTREVESSFDKAKSAAVAQGAEVVNSNMTRDPQGHSVGQLTVRAPAKTYDAVLDAFKKFGRVASLAIQRNDRAGDDESGPVLISLTLTSDEAPVQQTNLSVLSEKVEEKAAALKQSATAAGAEVKNSTFERQTGGVEVANLSLRIPMKSYAPFVEQLKRLGKVTNFTVHRTDSAEGASESAPAQIDVQVYSRGDIVPEENGVWLTLRRTFMQAVAALMWSLRMIGVALAFVGPWILAVALLAWIIRSVRRFRSSRK